MSHLRNRLLKLETHAAPPMHSGCLRLIQDGDLTPAQSHEIDDAKASGKFVIIRNIVDVARQEEAY
jgi:hypothetical protein